MSLAKFMHANVSILPASLSLTSAMAKLASDSYGVVVTKTGSPVGVVKGTDLAVLKDKGVKSLTQAVQHFESPLIIGSTIEMKTVARVIFKQVRSEDSGTVYVPPTIVLNKTGVAGILRDSSFIDLISEVPGIEIPKKGLSKRRVSFAPRLTFSEFSFGGGGGGGGAGGGGGGVGPPPQIELGGTGRSIQVICAEPDCGFVNTVFRVPKPGHKKHCKNPDRPPHFLKIGR